jgi:hypothetical protein
MGKGKGNNSPKNNPPKRDTPKNDPPKRDTPRNDPPRKDPPRTTAPTTPFQDLVNSASQRQPDKPAKKETIKLGGKEIANTFGKKLGQKELEKLVTKTGLTPESIITKVKDRLDIGIRPGARTYASTWTPGGTTPGGDDGTNKPPEGLTEEERQKYLDEIEGLKTEKATLFQNLADFTTDVQKLENEGDLDVAKAYADADIKKGEYALEGTKYAADKEAGWRTDVANIEVKGKLDLQPIINAGLSRVAEIEGQSARDVAETTGKYSLQSMQTRSEADKSIGKMQLAGGMYGLLGAAFG